jgi:hypothetical protein
MAVMARILYRIKASLAISALIALNACGGGNHGGTATYTLGGSVSGLTGSGFILQDNGADDLSIAADGAFSFATPLAAGAAYNVTVSAQPNTPGETCVVANGIGTATATVTSIAVTCAVRYTVGGSVSGLTGSGLVLQNNGGNNLTVAANGAFSFATPLAVGAAYNVTVSAQPLPARPASSPMALEPRPQPLPASRLHAPSGIP